MPRLLVCLFFCCWGYLVQAQTQAPVPAFANINVDDGLSQSSVYSIFQDSKGYMWFGTADGINRYDGAETKSYKLRNGVLKNSANAMFIRGKLVEDSLSNIWFANATGIYRYLRRSDSIEIAVRFDKTPYSGMWAGIVHLDKNNNLWLAESYLGLLTYNLVTKKLHYYKYELNDISAFIKVKQLFFAAQDDKYLWFSRDKTEGLFRVNVRTQKIEEFFKGKDYVCATFYGHKMILASPNFIDIYTNDFKLEQSIALPKLDKSISVVNNITIGNDGRLWLTIYQEGLFSYDFTTKKFTQFKKISNSNSLSSDLTTTLCLDKTNNLWVGTDGGGVCRLDLKPPLFNVFKEYDKNRFSFLDDYFTKCFYEDPQRNIWFGTANNGFGIYHSPTGALKLIKSAADGKPITNVGCIFKDSKGQIWVGHSNGIGIFNESNGHLIPIKINGKPKQEILYTHLVYKIVELKNGMILAATKNGLIKFGQQSNGTYAGEYLSAILELTSSATDIVAFKPDEILFSTEFKGVYHFKIYHFKVSANGFKLVSHYPIDCKVNSLCIDSKNRNLLWMGADMGLIKLNLATRQTTVFTEKDGMANSFVYGVLEDEKNNLWFSTNGGISCFNKQNSTFINYTHKNGLQSNEFNSGAYYRSASGQFYFGGIKGFNWFNPATVLQLATINQPEVTITSLTINDSTFVGNPNTNIKLPYWKNQLDFHFSVLDYTSPVANHIQYQLVGADKDMVTSYLKTVRYNKLPPGHYTLKLYGINSYNAKSNLKQLDIIIAPPFWQTWPFYLIVTVVAISLLVWLTKRISYQKLKKRIEELERQQLLEKERQRIGREMHDDIAAGLTQINMMSRIVANNKANVHEQELLEIAETSNKLISNMGDIIWNLSNQLNFADFIAHLREKLHKILLHSNINYQLDLPHITENNIVLSPEKQRNLMLITQEIVHNAIKHSDAKNIEVKLSIAHKQLIFTIKDDGKGCDFNDAKKGNGLKNIHYRIQQINGKISITSKVGSGCRFDYSTSTP